MRSAAERVAGVLSGERGGGRGEEEEGEEGEGEEIGERRGTRDEENVQGGEEIEGNEGGDGRGERGGMREGDVEEGVENGLNISSTVVPKGHTASADLVRKRGLVDGPKMRSFSRLGRGFDRAPPTS